MEYIVVSYWQVIFLWVLFWMLLISALGNLFDAFVFNINRKVAAINCLLNVMMGAILFDILAQ